VFKLRFSITEVSEWAARYPVADDAEIEMVIAPAARARGYFTKPELQTICTWKTPRSKPRITRNPKEFIGAVTRTALSTPNERLRIEVLTLLDGISWASGSVILHFAHNERYPIVDFRTLWSLSIDQPPVYDFNFWWNYTKYCRELADQAGVSMRTLDRALWTYSKENQEK
jgi:hypothetical protein